MAACKFCGAKTDTRVWTKGQKRFWTAICRQAACWKKYWKGLGA